MITIALRNSQPRRNPKIGGFLANAHHSSEQAMQCAALRKQQLTLSREDFHSGPGRSLKSGYRTEMRSFDWMYNCETRSSSNDLRLSTKQEIRCVKSLRVTKLTLSKYTADRLGYADTRTYGWRLKKFLHLPSSQHFQDLSHRLQQCAVPNNRIKKVTLSKL